jgi:hypothetical protein
MESNRERELDLSIQKKGMAAIDGCGSCAVVAIDISSGLPFSILPNPHPKNELSEIICPSHVPNSETQIPRSMCASPLL